MARGHTLLVHKYMLCVVETISESLQGLLKLMSFKMARGHTLLVHKYMFGWDYFRELPESFLSLKNILYSKTSSSSGLKQKKIF